MSSHLLSAIEGSCSLQASPLQKTCSTLTPPQTISGRFLHHIKEKFLHPPTSKCSGTILSPSRVAGRKLSPKAVFCKQQTLSPTLIKRKREDIEDLLRSGGDQDEVPEPDEFPHFEPRSIISREKKFPVTSDFDESGMNKKYVVLDIDSNNCSIDDDVKFDPRNCDSSSSSVRSPDINDDEEKRDIDTIIDVNMIIDNIKVPSFQEFVRERETRIEKRRESNLRYSITNSCFLGLPFAERINSLKNNNLNTVQSRPRISSFEIR